MPKPRVFVSSTFYDLRQIREDLERFIRDLGYEPVRHETGAIAYGSERAPDEYAYREVETCDIVISVIGGRFGSQSSEDASQSVSQMELKRALESGIQVFIFIDKNVRSEFHTYQLNKDTPGIKYRFVDDVRIYAFIEELLQLPSNNPISTFEVCSDIIDYLGAQWAGLFQRLLHDARRGSEQTSPGRRVPSHQPDKPTVEAGVVRQLLGGPSELPDGLIALNWAQGPSTLDVELRNTSPSVLDDVTLQVLDIHRWSDEHPRFVQSPDIHEKGRFTPLILHTQHIASHGGYIGSSGAYAAFHDTPLTFLFLSVEGDHLQFSGQRGSGLAVHTIRSPGTWRVCFRTLLRGPGYGPHSQSPGLVGTSFLFFKWDGATALVPCDPPLTS